MAITEAFQNSGTIGTTEWFLASNSATKTDQTTDGIIQLLLELNNLALGDTFRIRLYERISSGGTARIVEEWTVTGVQSTPNWMTPAFVLMHGWEFSLTKTAGTDRSIAWSIRSVA
jgi:hypothetical protein